MWHIAALVGPFHAKEAYMAVNYQGTLNVLNACRWVLSPGCSTHKLLGTFASTQSDAAIVDGYDSSISWC